MTPLPKRKPLVYKKYTDFIRRQRCAKTGRTGNGRSRQVVNCHQRQLHGGGTSLKPSDFHQLPLLEMVHRVREHGINGGYVFTVDEAVNKCLQHVIGYLMLEATEYERIQALDLLGDYIAENKI